MQEDLDQVVRRVDYIAEVRMRRRGVGKKNAINLSSYILLSLLIRGVQRNISRTSSVLIILGDRENAILASDLVILLNLSLSQYEFCLRASAIGSSENSAGCIQK